jgi:dTMP kinase
LWPDLNVLLVVSAPLAPVVAPDRLEAAGDEFHKRVAEGFLAQAADDPAHWAVVDGDGTEKEVARRVLDVVRQRLP